MSDLQTYTLTHLHTSAPPLTLSFPPPYANIPPTAPGLVPDAFCSDYARPPGRAERGISQRKEVVHMRSYEVMFIAHPDLDEPSLTALLDKAKGWVTAGGGAVTQVDLWGRRRLAYSIRKQKEG